MADQPELPNVDLTSLTVRDKVGNLRPLPFVVRSEKKLSYMWGHEGRRCKHCARFKVVQYAKKYFKCSIYGDTSSAATDWRANWPACGSFEDEKTCSESSTPSASK